MSFLPAGRDRAPFVLEPAAPVPDLAGPDLTRRAALRGLAGLGLGTGLLMSDPAAALAQQLVAAGGMPQGQPEDFWTRDRTIWVRRSATGEVIRSTYWSRGRLIDSEYQRLCWFARDITLEGMLRTGAPAVRRALDTGKFTPEQVSQWTYMNPIILDVHYAISSWLSWFNMARPIDWTSAFRHPITNSVTEGAARDSWHTKGGAIDSRIQGVPTRQFARFAQWLGAGGVGVYTSDGFTHTDAGRVRKWGS